MTLADRVALVTGAAKPDSIGHAVALGLAREGAHVAIADLYEAGFADVTRAIEAVRPAVPVRPHRRGRPRLGGRDGEPASSRPSAGWTCSSTPSGEAGASRRDDLTAPPRRGFVGLTNCSLADWRTILGVNLDGAFHCARAVAPYLRRAGGGAIVNFASVAARKGLAPGSEGSSGPYAVAKAGIMALTRQLAVELGADGVRVNCVAPGVVLSGRARRLMAAVGTGARPRGRARRRPARPVRHGGRGGRARRRPVHRRDRLRDGGDHRRQRRRLLRLMHLERTRRPGRWS